MMDAALAGDVDPLVQDDAGEGFRHGSGALFGVHGFGLHGESLGDSVAFNVKEGLNLAFPFEHPAERLALWKLRGPRIEGAVSMQKHDDGRIDTEAGNDGISAHDFRIGVDGWSGCSGFRKISAQCGVDGIPGVDTRGIVRKDDDRGMSGNRRRQSTLSMRA